MLERIKTSLCHPRYIGLFFKDKVYRIIVLLFVSFAIYAAAVFTRAMLTDQFGYNEALAVQKLIQYQTDSNGKKPTLKISYDATTHKLTGEKIVCASDTVVVTFLQEGNAVKKDAIAINLTENGYSIYYSYYYLGSGDLNDSTLKSFDLAKVQAGDTTDSMNFRSFLITIFDHYQYKQAAIVATRAVVSSLLYYALVIFLCLISAFFINPGIEFKIRVRLVLYDTLPYFYWSLIAVLLNISWIQYVAILIPFIYVNITFAHIKRVR